MPDMLVKLYELPEIGPALKKMEKEGIEIRRAIAPEKHIVVQWVKDHFNMGWMSECEVAFANQPVSCFIAVKEGKLVGFACYDATCKDFFGPTGVDENYRGKGVGSALLLASLHAMAAQGYAYAIIGGAGPAEYYRKICGAIEIEGSTPGIYRGMLRGESTL